MQAAKDQSFINVYDPSATTAFIKQCLYGSGYMSHVHAINELRLMFTISPQLETSIFASYYRQQTMAS